MEHKINAKRHFDLFQDWEVMFEEEFTNPDELYIQNRLLTFCAIHHIPSNRVFVGSAVLKPIDNYDQFKGRKVAFGYALDSLIKYKNYGKNKPLRTIFWEALLPQL